MRKLLNATFALMFSLVLSGSKTVVAEEFYAGKTIRIVVGAGAGGGFDTYARLFARHVANYIPGQPSIIVQNMPGAGMLIAAKYLISQAKPDGLTIGHWTGALILQNVMGNPAANMVDGRKIGWLGAPLVANSTCVLSRQSGIKTVEDWFKSPKPLKFGGQGTGSSTSDTPRMLKAALGLPIQVVEGYSGTAAVRLAIESGEMDGLCGWGWESIKTTAYDKVKSGDLTIVLQSSLERHPELKQIPAAMEYAKDERARTLIEVDAYNHGTLERVFSLPPGVPEERVRLLQKAFMDTWRDPELLKEAAKAKFEISPVDGPAIAKDIRVLYQLKPALVEELKVILGGKKG